MAVEDHLKVTSRGALDLAEAWGLSETTHRVLRTDNHWQRIARLGQVAWAAGSLGVDVTGLDLPWRLPPELAAGGANFHTEAARAAVDEAIRTPEAGALIDVNRLHDNLLSSQPLAFNVFGPLWADRDLASRVLSPLFPDVVAQVNEVRFEHNPKRGAGGLTGSRSAFDVFIDAISPDGQRSFLGIEVKYHESGGTSWAPRDPRVSGWARLLNADVTQLCRPPLGQLFADHCLALALLDPATPADSGGGEYKSGRFVLLYPGDNMAMRHAWEGYAQATAPPDQPADVAALEPPLAHGLSLYSLLWQIEQATAEKWPEELCARYIDSAEYLGYPLPEDWH